MSRYSGYFILKEKISSAQHSHQVLYFLTSRLSTNHPTSICHSDSFIIPTNIYYSSFIPPQTHDLDLQPPLQPLLLYLPPHIIWHKMVFTTPPMPCWRNLKINFTSKMKNWIYECTHCKPRLKIDKNPKNSHSPCHSRSQRFYPDIVTKPS